MTSPCFDSSNTSCDVSEADSTQKPVSVVSNMTWDDATWILTSSFIIFTMQSGFGLLESGMSDAKNEVNIMVKNAVDVIFGGLTFWMFGFGISFGDGPNSTPFVGVGYFFVNAKEDTMGFIYSWFFFQLSFATTATTIVSGAMAERTKLVAYIVYSFLNTIVYSMPAHWCWAKKGFLHNLGFVDIAGAGPVHLVGGMSGLVATLMLGPRTGRFQEGSEHVMGSPTNALLGMFMLWWGWLGFNCGSTFGISGGKWKLAARAAVVTVMSSMSGGAMAFILSYIKTKRFHIEIVITGLLASLVSCTASCALVHPWEALIIGGVGTVLATLTEPMLVKLKIDDPVGVIPVHCVSGVWSILAVGLLVDNDNILGLTQGRQGLFKGGGWYLIGIQALSAVIIMVWSISTSYLLLKFLDVVIGLRVSREEELLGSDFIEHGIDNFDVTQQLQASQKDEVKPTPVSKFLRGVCCLCRRRRCKNSSELTLQGISSNAVTLHPNDNFDNEAFEREPHGTLSLHTSWL